MTNRSKSTLFLIEQLIVIAVFAICAAACISILTAAYFNASDSSAASHAILRAESAAEVFKATGGDGNTVAEVLSGTYNTRSGHSTVTVHYDNDWQLSHEVYASYMLSITYYATAESIIEAELTVERITGEELVSFPLAARKR